MATYDIDWLIIAEKENQAQDIAKALFDKKKPTGITTKSGLGCFGGSSILDGNVIITRAQGHLYKLAYPEKQDKRYTRTLPAQKDEFGFEIGGGWKSDAEMLKVYPIELNLQKLKYETAGPHQKRLALNLKKLFTRAKNIIIATDGDPEGEMIFI